MSKAMHTFKVCTLSQYFWVYYTIVHYLGSSFGIIESKLNSDLAQKTKQCLARLSAIQTLVQNWTLAVCRKQANE